MFCFTLFLILYFLRQYGATRGRLEGVQWDGDRPVRGQGQRVHEEQGRLHRPSPQLPERAQPVQPGAAATRLPPGRQEQRMMLLAINANYFVIITLLINSMGTLLSTQQRATATPESSEYSSAPNAKCQNRTR